MCSYSAGHHAQNLGRCFPGLWYAVLLPVKPLRRHDARTLVAPFSPAPVSTPQGGNLFAALRFWDSWIGGSSRWSAVTIYNVGMSGHCRLCPFRAS